VPLERVLDHPDAHLSESILEAEPTSATGILLQRDPAGYADSVNLYAFAGNDPVNRRDITGAATEDEIRACVATGLTRDRCIDKLTSRFAGPVAHSQPRAKSCGFGECVEQKTQSEKNQEAARSLEAGLAGWTCFLNPIACASSFLATKAAEAAGVEDPVWTEVIGAAAGTIGGVAAAHAASKVGAARIGGAVSSGSPAGGTVFVDADVLALAAERSATPLGSKALSEIRSANTRLVTPNQFREFTDFPGITSAQRTSRVSFMATENVELFGGPRAGAVAQTPEFQEAFRAIERAQGRGDAALVAFSRATGTPAITANTKLVNFIDQTMGASPAGRPLADEILDLLTNIRTNKAP
jgi:hypothetical protein